MASHWTTSAQKLKIMISEISSKRWKDLGAEKSRKRTDKSFMVTKDDIVTEGYDLSISRYKKVVYQEVKHDNPKVIIKRIKDIQKDMAAGVKVLEGLL